MMSLSPGEILERQSVHESNEPHGENAQAAVVVLESDALYVT